MIQFYQSFLLLTRGKQIAAVVCLLHLLAIFGLLGHHLIHRKSAPARPIVVRHVVPAAPPPPKPSAPAPLPPKPVAAAPKPAAKKPTPAKKVEKQLPPLPAPTPKKRPEITLPAPLRPKEQIEAPDDPNYGEFLIAYLQNALDLPEYGEVKARLEIDRYGNLVRCEILETKSQRNGEFLKNRLPELSFPCLKETQSFTITFRNAEIR